MLLVDAYNVLHAPGASGLMRLDASAGDLAALVAVSRYRRNQPLLVCDGAPPPRGLGPSARPVAEWRYELERVQILFAGPGHDADSLIETLIERNTAPARLTVVSSDRRLQRAARRRRAKRLDSRRFIERLESDASADARAWRRPGFTQQVPLDAEQVRYWSRVLGVDGVHGPGGLHASPVPAAPPAVADRAPAAAGPTQRDQDSTPVDPLIAEALEEWRGRLHLDDLDMDRWLRHTDTPPDRPPRSR